MKTIRNCVAIVCMIVLGLLAANSAQADINPRVGFDACQQGFWNTSDGVKLFYVDTTTESPIIFWPTSDWNSKQLWFMAAGPESWAADSVTLGLYQPTGPFDGPYVNVRVGTFTLFNVDGQLQALWNFQVRIPGLCETAGFSPAPPSCRVYQPVPLIQATRPVGCE